MWRGLFKIKHYFQIAFYLLDYICWYNSDFSYQPFIINRANLINHDIT